MNSFIFVTFRSAVFVPFSTLCLFFASGRKLTPQGQRDLDRIAGQVRAPFWGDLRGFLVFLSWWFSR